MKKKKGVKDYLIGAFTTLIMLAMGGCVGLLMAKYMKKAGLLKESPAALAGGILYLLFVLYLSMFLQIVIHESGHLLFGLLSGYGFTSFRIGSLMLIKKDGKFMWKHFSLAGTGGQCLMDPPPFKDGKVPSVLYNLGGIIMNLAAAALFGGLGFLLSEHTMISIFCIAMGIVGTAIALMNGIPMNQNGITNDGCNALLLGKTPEALRAFWIQMKINQSIANGMRLRDMPEEWFALPSREEMQNSLSAAIAVFACNRLMDEMRLEEADALMEQLLSGENRILGLHKSLLKLDGIYCELMGQKRAERLELMEEKEMKKFMKAMKNFPSVLRTQYAYALLWEKDEKKAQELMDKFNKMARKYPYPSDLEPERELMARCSSYVEVG